MSSTILPPTKAIIEAGERLNEAIERLLRTVPGPPIGRYEADVEAGNLLKLVIRHVEGVIALSLNDLVLLPSAMVIARACYEAAIKAMWMATPDDPFDREVRWLAHLVSVRKGSGR
jgi:hypothetical protein